MTKAVSQANINARSIKAITIPLPPPNSQEEIVGLAKNYADARATVERQVTNAGAVRRALLNHLLATT
jgi:restriction endonuclease S subunit